MSRSRQIEPAVRGYAVTHPPGVVTLPAEAGWNQLLYTATGAMTVQVATGAWTIPPHRALWLPDGERASVVIRTRVAVRSLYFASSLSALPDATRAFDVPPFCRELLLHTVRCCPLGLDDDVHRALLTLIVDELRGLPDAPLWLPWPADPRAADVAAAAAIDPTTSSGTLARQHGTSRRTVERIFAAETGLSLGAWRRRARILGSLTDLAAGASVTGAALRAGYTTPSAYVAAFRRELGVAPRQFLRSRV